MGGQTALNLAMQLAEAGVLEALGVELIGAGLDAIRRAEDRELFRDAVRSVGLRVPSSRIIVSLEELTGVSLPAVVRPAFTLGGHGGGFAASPADLRRQVEAGLRESPIGQVLVEESVRGWDEFELEVVRDRRDNVVVVCSIENLDPMGVHTGDSVTVAPQMTLSDEAYQELRDAAAAIVRAVGVECGGSNIQFARDRETGDVRVIEMNPRVSRSSALASKATGYPIAKVAAKLAVGYTLDEIPNDLTRTTPASFEPTLDYVVVKVPRFAFEKFPGADTTLGTQMKSVGEAMGIGRTFSEAFLKALRSRELDGGAVTPWASLDELPEGLHPWFRAELARLRLEPLQLDDLVADDWLRLKRRGFSDADSARACGGTEDAAQRKRREWGVRGAPAVPAEREGGPEDHGEGQVLRDVRKRRDDQRLRHLQPGGAHRFAEALAVLGPADHLGGRADQLDPERIEHACLCQLEPDVERRLPAHRRQQRVRALPAEHIGHGVDVERLEVRAVGKARVGHDRRRIRVDDDGAEAVLAEHLQRLAARVVELAGLPDHDRA